jgi:parvulin-like peptidyl-prolyl isomerase
VTEEASVRPSAFWPVVAVVLVSAAGLYLAFGPRPEPARVKVQHILISFAGAGTTATRTKAAAEQLAGETLSRARDGEDFDKLMKALSDDTAGGTYAMSNTGKTPQGEEFSRDSMVKSFGDLGFKLRVGGIGLAPHHPKDSPYGWHIIKRLE